eukprot:Gregarina_sp_Poly_1__10787@NODE_829_length_6100_cov_40_875849_g600_i0_p10_GENE_NODE_829_length_6100_cov_40_875849_g600_i0NODE_829_length_6100_cov_40_875849_g600_i0_p10_ORF_typecomplete_len101_score9_89_NODE_829_length_6100_cov_40_875849_g600_i017262028
MDMGFQQCVRQGGSVCFQLGRKLDDYRDTSDWCVICSNWSSFLEERPFLSLLNNLNFRSFRAGLFEGSKIKPADSHPLFRLDRQHDGTSFFLRVTLRVGR